MTTPIEEFVIALAKVSKRPTHWLRSFEPADRQDVIAIGLAWAWEHREEFNPAEESLERWWNRHLRYFAAHYRRAEERHQTGRVHTPIEALEALGQERGGVRHNVDDEDEEPIFDKTPFGERFGTAPIDHEIEKLLSGPRVGMKDCPPCWRCMYFEGWTPNMERYRPPTHVDPEIQEALFNIEARKIAIGFGERR